MTETMIDLPRMIAKSQDTSAARLTGMLHLHGFAPGPRGSKGSFWIACQVCVWEPTTRISCRTTADSSAFCHL